MLVRPEISTDVQSGQTETSAPCRPQEGVGLYNSMLRMGCHASRLMSCCDVVTVEDADGETGRHWAQVQLCPPGVDHYGNQHCILAALLHQCNTPVHVHTPKFACKHSFVYCDWLLLSQAQIHLIGNPVSWGVANVSLLAYQLLASVYLLRRRRGFRDLSEGTHTHTNKHTQSTCFNTVSDGWRTTLFTDNKVCLFVCMCVFVSSCVVSVCASRICVCWWLVYELCSLLPDGENAVPVSLPARPLLPACAKPRPAGAHTHSPAQVHTHLLDHYCVYDFGSCHVTISMTLHVSLRWCFHVLLVIIKQEMLFVCVCLCVQQGHTPQCTVCVHIGGDDICIRVVSNLLPFDLRQPWAFSQSTPRTEVARLLGHPVPPTVARQVVLIQKLPGFWPWLHHQCWACEGICEIMLEAEL